MRVEQVVTVEGEALVITLVEHSSGKQIARRIYGELGKYVRQTGAPSGYIQLLIPTRAGLDIKTG